MVPATSDSLTRTEITGIRRIELITLFGLLTVFTPIGIDLYLPALPTIARDFGTPIAAVEHSLAAFFLGLCIGQVMVGPLSDRFGRRWPILGGLGLYILGATGCALAQDPITLDIARFVEAVGGSACTVLARACVRDLFPPEQAARIFAQMLLILSVSPLFAPFVGAWLAQPVLAARRRGAADLGLCLEIVAGKSSRLRPPIASLACTGRLLGHPARPALLPLHHSRHADGRGPLCLSHRLAACGDRSVPG